MSSFVSQRTQEIFQNASSDALQTPSLATTANQSRQQQAETLRNTLAGLHTPPTDEQLAKGLHVLNDPSLVTSRDGKISYAVGIEERVIAGLYARSMEALLKQAVDADNEAQFWWDVERSRYNTVRFLVQTFPIRAYRMTTTMLASLRHRNIPITFSTFQLSSIRTLFPSTTRPSELLMAFFPHLHSQHRFFSDSPLALTRDECRLRRKDLEALRDDRALRIGILAAASHDLEKTMASTHSRNQLNHHVELLQTTLSLDNTVADMSNQELTSTWLDEISNSNRAHSKEISPLRRPSRIIQIWPRFFLLPPAAYLLFRYVYQPRASIAQHAREAWETTRVFWESWILQPIKGILATVRTGGDERIRVISKEALRADMDSLERMAIALGKEKLGYTQQQIDILHDQVQRGDLTVVLKVYEEDIKSPIRSAITGTLVRSLLIQVQKMKVDVDFALSGIDKLLRSQELTFGFVGVAPALAVVYLFSSWLLDSWRGGKGKGKYGGKKERAKVWNAMRRIEKLLISQPKMAENLQAARLFASYNALGINGVNGRLGFNSADRAQQGSRAHEHEIRGGDQEVEEGDNGVLSPLTNGLLLLASTQLRTFADRHLTRSNSGFKDLFLEDVRDLEDGLLSVSQKREVVRRMWRSWGRVLGWDNLAEL